MAFSLGTLFEAVLLIINAIAILSEERFLSKGMREFSFQVTPISPGWVTTDRWIYHRRILASVSAQIFRFVTLEFSIHILVTTKLSQ